MGVGFWWDSVNWAPGMDALGGGLGLQGFVIYAELGALLRVCEGGRSLVSNSGTSSLQVKQLVP